MLLIQYQSCMGNDLALYLVPDNLEDSVDLLIKKAEKDALKEEMNNAKNPQYEFDDFDAVEEYLISKGFIRTFIDKIIVSEYL